MPVGETEAGETITEVKFKKMTVREVLSGRPQYRGWLEFSIIGHELPFIDVRKWVGYSSENLEIKERKL